MPVDPGLRAGGTPMSPLLDGLGDRKAAQRSRIASPPIDADPARRRYISALLVTQPVAGQAMFGAVSTGTASAARARLDAAGSGMQSWLPEPTAAAHADG